MQGLFGWVECGVDTDRLAAVLHDEGWLLAPGSLFHARLQPSTLMRVNFAAAQEARVWRALRDARNRLAPADRPPTDAGAAPMRIRA